MRAVRWWLWTVFGFVFAVVAVGGITRLPGSGRSMVAPHPLLGGLPPLDEEAWLAVFGQYQESPQYAQVNHWMQLGDFKRIFFWEYLHRLLGRLVGVVFVIPWVVFLARGTIRGRLLRATAIALLLGAAQGVLGWLMVKSGLVDRPSVSHYRLAAHLCLAFAVAQWVLWILLDLRPSVSTGQSTASMRRGIAGALVLLVLQIVYGAFMAGTDAGLISPTFPDMNGHYGPGPFVHGLADLVQSPVAIHWVHRTLAWLVLLAFAWLAWRSRKEPREVRNVAFLALAIVVAQIAFGALTVIFHVPTSVAVLHQCIGFVLLSATTWLAYRAGLLKRRTYQPAA